MKKKYTADEISKFFKAVFVGEKGEVVLERIRSFCLGNVQQNMASIESTNQTFYNLGANSVYRYIQHQIDKELNQTADDCDIENQEKQGE